jgi:hypothetical protein
MNEFSVPLGAQAIRRGAAAPRALVRFSPRASARAAALRGLPDAVIPCGFPDSYDEHHKGGQGIRETDPIRRTMRLTRAMRLPRPSIANAPCLLSALVLVQGVALFATL